MKQVAVVAKKKKEEKKSEEINVEKVPNPIRWTIGGEMKCKKKKT